jgi:hypothetical protein
MHRVWRSPLPSTGEASAMNGIRRVWCQALALGGVGAWLTFPVRAHDLPSRRLVIERTPPRGLTLSYQLDVIEFLHPLLARAANRVQFLQQFGSLSEPDLDRALRPARAAVQSQTRVTAPDGRAVPVTDWEWPPTSAWHQHLKAATFLLQAGQGVPEHVGWVTIHAQVRVPPRAARLQLRAPAALLPLLIVNGVADQFWLTDQAPLGMLDL